MKVPRWEYNVVQFGREVKHTLERTLHYFGCEGWELIDVRESAEGDRFIFKRRGEEIDSPPRFNPADHYNTPKQKE